MQLSMLYPNVPFGQKLFGGKNSSRGEKLFVGKKFFVGKKLIFRGQKLFVGQNSSGQKLCHNFSMNRRVHAQPLKNAR